jgi:HAD superfamily hydrolase (TIGR01549 family)
MKRPLGIIFDFGSTVLTEKEFDSLSGNKKMLESAMNPRNLTPAEVQTFANEIYSGLHDVREKQYVEFSEQNFQRLLYETLGITLNIDPEEAERQFWYASSSFTPAEGIVEVLDFLRKNNIKTGILSNSMFSGNILGEELAKHNLIQYFSFVVASSDYGFRKPSPHIFKVAIKKMNLETVDIWYVGDTLEYDIKGALLSGLYPVWYNPEGKMKTFECDCLEVRSWSEFVEKLRMI